MDDIRNVMMFSAEDINRTTDFMVLSRRLANACISGGGGIDVPQRVCVIKEEPFKAFDTMPAVSESLGLFVVKIGSVIAANAARRASVNALVVAFCTRTGRPLAILDGDAITQLKCAAVSALVTAQCAPVDAGVLAIIGSGVQAGIQARAVCAVRNISEIRIHSRDISRCEDFARKVASWSEGVNVQVFDTSNEACRGAQIIATATTSTMPVISASAVDGCAWHINCVGNHLPTSREVPPALMNSSTLIVEDVQTAVNEAGASHIGAISLREMMALPAHTLQGKKTIFASTGHAFLDLHAVHYVLDAAGVLEGV